MRLVYNVFGSFFEYVNDNDNNSVIVYTKNDLYTLHNAYEGISVYVKDEKKTFTLIAADYSNPMNWSSTDSSLFTELEVPIEYNGQKIFSLPYPLIKDRTRLFLNHIETSTYAIDNEDVLTWLGDEYGVPLETDDTLILKVKS